MRGGGPRMPTCLIVNHALFVTDLALRAAGLPMLPDYDIAIIDEAHTLEAVAGEHLGLKLSSIGVDYTLSRLYNERTEKGLLSVHKVRQGDSAGTKRPRNGHGRSLRKIADWLRGQPAGFNGRVRKPLGLAGASCRRACTRLRRPSATRPAKSKTRPSGSSSTRPRSGAGRWRNEVSDWLKQADEEAVYWVEVEEKSRLRVRLAAAPLDVAPALQENAFQRGADVRVDIGHAVRGLAAAV